MLMRMSDPFTSLKEAYEWARLQTQVTRKGGVLYIVPHPKRPVWQVYRTETGRDRTEKLQTRDHFKTATLMDIYMDSGDAIEMPDNAMSVDVVAKMLNIRELKKRKS